MALLHEIAGPILGSVAVILTLYIFKRTVDSQAYRDVDSNYADVLKLAVDHPHLRDPETTRNYEKITDSVKSKLRNEEYKRMLEYDSYVVLVLNVMETIYDRKKIDKTWLPVVKAEKELHSKWLQYDENWKYFKDEFRDFFRNTDFYRYNPWRMKIQAYIPYALVASLLIFIIVVIPLVYIYFPEFYADVQYFDTQIAVECAKDPEAYGLSVEESYRCSEFSPGSLAELCAINHEEFNKRDQRDCLDFISPDNSTTE
jgi:hypothetical protein